jgi:uncharacterized lipoprotein YmbA
MLQAAMVQDLAQRLPAATVLGSGGTIGVTADVLIEINVLRFDPDSTGKIVLSAQFAVRSEHTHALLTAQTYQSSAVPEGTDVSYSVAAMSQLLATMADQIAGLIVENSALNL